MSVSKMKGMAHDHLIDVGRGDRAGSKLEKLAGCIRRVDAIHGAETTLGFKVDEGCRDPTGSASEELLACVLAGW
jgi:hypothetical protein